MRPKISDLANFLAGVTSGYLALTWCEGVRGMLQGYAAVDPRHFTSGPVSDAKSIIQLTNHILRKDL